MELRDYQEECIEVLKSEKMEQLIHLPTGSGKTIIFLKYLSQSSQEALIVVPTLDLQNQVYESALFFYHKDEIYLKTDRNKIKPAKIYILVANSLNSEKMVEYFASRILDHIIIDEAHRSLSSTYEKFLNFYKTVNKNYK